MHGAALIREFRRANPDAFAWRQPPYEYEAEKLPIDILAGSDELRLQVEADMPVAEIAASWRDDEAAFTALRRPFLRYES